MVTTFHPFPLGEVAALAGRGATLLLFETARADAENRYSYLFTDPVRELRAASPDAVPALLQALDSARQAYWVAGYLSYEAAYGLEPRLAALASGHPDAAPTAWFGLFREPLIFDHQSGRWQGRPPPRVAAGLSSDPAVTAGPPTLLPLLEPSDYTAAVAEIRRLIRAGDTYQVNFTFDSELYSPLAPLALYRQLRRAQAVPYSTLLQHAGQHVLSFSPELFLRVHDGVLTTRPMKGTAARGRTPVEDQALGAAMAADPKVRAENLMIVDLLRNDLGKVCRTGSVEVPSLFAVEAHRTVLQLTSTVRGRLRAGTPLSAVLRALFPCGSVTGAPKLRTMEIIAALERGARGVYCGALGFAAPGGDAVFSVPIRTLQRRAPLGPWQFRVGSGIVWDSDATDEWRECLAKCAFLTAPTPDFELVETLRLGDGYTFAEAHWERLAASAAYWDFPCSAQRWAQTLAAAAAHWSGRGPARIRVLLDARGGWRWEGAALEPPPAEPAVVLLSPVPVDEHNPWLYHKTTHRPWYREAEAAIRAGCVYDWLFVNSRGELTEGARSNLFVQRDDRLCTPPVACGLLDGVFRQDLIRSGRCAERVLHPEDLCSADAVYCGNSVRGLVRVHLLDA